MQIDAASVGRSNTALAPHGAVSLAPSEQRLPARRHRRDAVRAAVAASVPLRIVDAAQLQRSRAALLIVLVRRICARYLTCSRLFVAFDW